MAEARSHLAPPTQKLEDYYKLLSLKPKATLEEIKQTFRRLAMEYHPDQAQGKSELEANALFSKISQAYNVLSDPVSRALYDISQGYIKDSKAQRQQINRDKRKDAERMIELCEATVQQSRIAEMQVNGLIVLEALYGDVSLASDNQNLTEDEVGRCIDVSVPLQFAVKNSALIVHGGGSKAWLEGFYDPNDDEFDNLLYVRYKFDGRLHECLVNDTDELMLPMLEHLVEDAPMSNGEDDEEYEGESETDVSSVDSRDSDAVDAAVRRAHLRRAQRRQKRMAHSSVRSSALVKPRWQVQQEVAAIKARRRRNLYIGVGGAIVALGLYLAHKWKWINLFDFVPKALLPASAWAFGMGETVMALPAPSPAFVATSVATAATVAASATVTTAAPATVAQQQ